MQPGQYTVTLSVTSPAGNDVTARVNYITVAPLPADLDADGDVDQSDFGRLQRCYSGSGIVQSDPACANARLDADTDVDADDFGRLLNCMRGSGVIPDPACVLPP
jgi:PKD repeat protein